MKKALFAALCFILIGFIMVNGTFAQLDIGDIFKELGGAFGSPTHAPGKVDVELVNVGKVEQLYPGSSATYAVAVKNNGSLDACFRLAFAVQYDAETWDKLNISFTAGNEFIRTEEWTDISVGGTPYRMHVFTSEKALAAAAQSGTVTITIAMDRDITSQQIVRYRSDFLQTQVLAIEADLFMQPDENGAVTYTAVEALDMALPLDGFNPFN